MNGYDKEQVATAIVKRTKSLNQNFVGYVPRPTDDRCNGRILWERKEEDRLCDGTMILKEQQDQRG